MVQIEQISSRKVRITRAGVIFFNRRWPCSKLDPARSYWFEFDAKGDLVDTDVPEHSDGPEASALADDAKAFLFEDQMPGWYEKFDITT